MHTRPGHSRPLGAHWDGEGVNFALFSAHATRVELCLFDEGGNETDRFELPERTGDVWHGKLPGLAPGQLYGYRVDGPWAPNRGHRFNSRKLLIDPYARALHGSIRWNVALFGHDTQDPEEPSRLDSAPFMPRCVVVEPEYDWRGDQPPSIAWSRTLIYECHVKGTTIKHPEVAEDARGRYAGLVSPAVINHLKELGVTAVELMPVHHAGIEEHLARSGLTNYWGYATIGFFAPDTRFATGNQPGGVVAEFRDMVRAFHDAGIEVILDVVYNHTPEGGPMGPTFSFRGIDNASYYRLNPADAGRYLDFSGTGHTINTQHPRIRQLVVDSLRYWAQEMHVDGFRFDLAPAIARPHYEFDPAARIFELIEQDPVLSGKKLIAEPWDLGPDGYRLSGFPLGWSEWNDRYRDVIRRYWRGDTGQVGEFASRIAGSSDIFGASRGPTASVNYVCSHDGFTLRDLVSYSRKHNDANGESGRDGPNEESHNWGTEGPSRDRRIVRTRERMRRNFVATLALSNGIPMWLGGDEVGRTQNGNNNPYCQDNETSWTDWELGPADKEFLDFVKRCFELRRGNAVFRRRQHLDDADSLTVRWLRPDGEDMLPTDWNNPQIRSLAAHLDARSVLATDEEGEPQTAHTVFLMFNGEARNRTFKVFNHGPGFCWTEVLNTACPHDPRAVREPEVRLAPHSLVLLQLEEIPCPPPTPPTNRSRSSERQRS